MHHAEDALHREQPIRDLVRGRGFAQAERSADVAVAVVSESAARQLWPGLDAVGQVLRLEPAPISERRQPDEPPLLSRTVVVGVARDVAGIQFGGKRMAGAGMAFWLTVTLGGLALLLTLSGLFSVLSYLVEQRAREIGVRMALGATRRSIGALVLSQSARPVSLGLLLGGSLAAALGAALLATPAAEQIGSTLRLFDPVAYAASLLCIVPACACAALVPALRAGRIDPIAALRQD